MGAGWAVVAACFSSVDNALEGCLQLADSSIGDTVFPHGALTLWRLFWLIANVTGPIMPTSICWSSLSFGLASTNLPAYSIRWPWNPEIFGRVQTTFVNLHLPHLAPGALSIPVWSGLLELATGREQLDVWISFAVRKWMATARWLLWHFGLIWIGLCMIGPWCSFSKSTPEPRIPDPKLPGLPIQFGNIVDDH